MRTLHKLQFLWSALVISHLSTVHSQLSITCVAGVYKTGEKANVTCLFNEDITTGKNTGVYISRRDFDASTSSEGKEVLKCSFTRNTVSLCEAEDGYRFVEFQKSSLTMEISNVTENVQGSYTCSVIPSDESAIQRTKHACILLMHEAHAYKAVGEVNCENGCSVSYANLVLLLILLIGGILAFVFAAYKMKWSSFSHIRSRLSRKKKADAEQASSPECEHLNTSEQTAPPSLDVDLPPSPDQSTGASKGKQDDVSKADDSLDASGIEQADEVEPKGETLDEIKIETKDGRRNCVVQ